MMSEPKPLASLSPSLLARKGAARPAMRRQTPGLGLSPAPGGPAGDFHDDLGWNDMGHDVPTPVAPLNPEMFDAPAEPSPVHQQHDELAQRLSLPVEAPAEAVEAPAAQPARVKTPVSKAVIASSRRAAFTLRIDAERHLKLRLACTIAGRSAQQLIIDALDEMTARIPEIEELASRMPRSTAK